MKQTETRTNANPVAGAPSLNESWPAELMELLPVAVFECDLSGCVTRYNSRAAELWGGNPECIGKMADLFGAALDEMLRRGEPIRNREVVLTNLNGEQRRVRLDASPLRDEAREPIGVAGCFQEISRSNQLGKENNTEQTSHADTFPGNSETQLPTGFAKAAIGFAMADREGRIVEANETFCRMTGYSREELCALRIQSITHPEDMEENQKLIRQILAGEIDNFVIQKRYVKKSGELVWARNSAYAIRDGNGRITHLAAVSEDVSEQKRVEEALYASELRFRTIFENAGVGIGLGDISGHPIKINRAFQEMLGYSEEELCGKRITEFTHPDDASRGWQLYEELVSGRRSRFDTIKRYIRKDGGTVWVRLIVSLIRDRAGRPEYTICLVLDLTERQLAERALQESQMHLQAILDNSPVLMWLKNSEGRYLQVNRKFEQCFGLTKEQIFGRSDAELFPQEQASAFRVHDLRVIETGRALEFDELANYRGKLHTSIVYKFPLKDDEGKVYAVGGIAADITERKQAEEALAKQKEILQTIFDHIPVMINLVDASGRVQLANREWEENLGWTLDELRKEQRELFSIFYPEPQEQQEVLDFIARADGEWRDFSPKVRSGKRIETAWAQVRLSDGRSLGIGQDITERKRAEVELRNVNERLHNLSRRLLEVQESERRTISRALHDEIGQAITAVALNLKNAKTASEPAQYASALDEGIETLNLVLQQIRTLSLDLRPSMLDDLGLASAIRWQVDKQAQRAGILASVKADNPGMRLPADVEVACYRIVQESLTNVVRHAKAKNVRVKLWIADSDLQLLIQDDGIGFDTGVVLGRGTNLGLIGMEERVSLLGGTFEIDSAEGCGTSVKASFPLGQFLGKIQQRDTESTDERGERVR